MGSAVRHAVSSTTVTKSRFGGNVQVVPVGLYLGAFPDDDSGWTSRTRVVFRLILQAEIATWRRDVPLRLVVAPSLSLSRIARDPHARSCIQLTNHTASRRILSRR